MSESLEIQDNVQDGRQMCELQIIELLYILQMEFRCLDFEQSTVEPIITIRP